VPRRCPPIFERTPILELLRGLRVGLECGGDVSRRRRFQDRSSSIRSIGGSGIRTRTVRSSNSGSTPFNLAEAIRPDSDAALSQLRSLGHAQESDAFIVFLPGLDQGGRVHREHVILDGLAKNKRESVPVAVPRRRRPTPFLALFEQPCLNTFACDPFGR
jgi:hypothetical protein